MSGGIAAAVLAAAVAAFALVLMGRQRRKMRARGGSAGTTATIAQDLVDVGLIAGGVAMALGTLAIGLSRLRIEEAPVRTSENIGVVPPTRAALGRGFTIGLAIEVESCDDPVRVTVAVGGTAEYWRDRAAQVPFSSRFLIAVPDKQLSAVRVQPSEDPTDVTGPLYEDVVLAGRTLRAVHPRVRFDVTVIGARLRRWGETQQPVIATFKADWLRKRGLGTCYLILPGLVGSDSISPAQQALGRASRDTDHIFPGVKFTSIDQSTGLSTPLEPHLEPTHGSTTVAVNRGQVLNDVSLPSPDASYDGYPKWTCEARPRRLEPLTRSGSLPELAAAKNPASVPVYSKTGLTHEHDSSCAGIAVIAEAGAASKRDLILLLMGTLISLAAAVAVEVLLDWRHSGGPLARWRRRRAIQTETGGEGGQTGATS